jgi:TonB family protein
MFSGPVIIQRVDPEYTDEALEAKIEGAVTVSGKIGTDGIPKDVTVAKGLGHGLNAKAVECSEKWRFQPAMRKGEPVEVRVSALVTFKLPAK